MVDIELELKAAHSVDSDKEMQSCAEAVVASKVRATKARDVRLRIEIAIV